MHTPDHTGTHAACALCNEPNHPLIAGSQPHFCAACWRLLAGTTIRIAE